MLFRLLKNASKWVFSYIEKSGRFMNEAEERLLFRNLYENKDKGV